MFTITETFTGGALPAGTKAVPCVFTEAVSIDLRRALGLDPFFTIYEGHYLDALHVVVQVQGKIVQLRSDKTLYVEGLVNRPDMYRDFFHQESVTRKYPRILPDIGYEKFPIWSALTTIL